MISEAAIEAIGELKPIPYLDQKNSGTCYMVTRKVVLASARVCQQKAPEAHGRAGTVVVLCTQKRVADVSFEFLSGCKQKGL